MKLLIAGNWKMFKTRAEAAATVTSLVNSLSALPEQREVVIFAPFTVLSTCAEILAKVPGISLGGQNCYPAVWGAFTGEVSPAMLKDSGCDYVLTGHSERRMLLGETDAFVGEKTAFALSQGIKAVLCVGEQLEERNNGKLQDVLVRQLAAGLADVPDNTSAAELSVAYEPVWAIGTGRVAGAADAQEVCAAVRAELGKLASPKIADTVRVLYGGSVNAKNVGELIGQPDVDGGLVGGASLDGEQFAMLAALAAGGPLP